MILKTLIIQEADKSIIIINHEMIQLVVDKNELLTSKESTSKTVSVSAFSRVHGQHSSSFLDFGQ